MTDDVFERRTRRFVETLEILERLRRTPWERFSVDPEKYGSAERFLQVAVEILDDLGAHLVARFGAGPVDRYRDIPDRLLTSGRLTEAQADVWRRVIGFRNVIVHNYLDVDRHRLALAAGVPGRAEASARSDRVLGEAGEHTAPSAVRTSPGAGLTRLARSNALAFTARSARSIRTHGHRDTWRYHRSSTPLRPARWW